MPVPSILIIEDDPGLSMMIGHTLRRSGFQVLTAMSGAAGISLALSNPPTLMLLDYALPDMLCTDLVRHLSLLNRCPPFIIVTGQGDERVAVKMMKLGARDYLIKDESLLELIPHVIFRACDELEREQRLVAANQEIKRLNAQLEARVKTRTVELHEAHQRARLMMEVAEGANHASDPESAIRVALMAACQQASAQVGHAWWFNADHTELKSSTQWHLEHPDAFSSFVSATQDHRWQSRVGIPGWIRTHKTPLWLPDVRLDHRFMRRKYAGRVGLRTGIFVPVLVEGAVRAILEVFGTRVCQEDPEVLEFLTRIAAQFGSVVRRRRAEDDLRKARDIADQANRAKSLFLASMSHEIRTPMNAILGFAQILQNDRGLDAHHRDHLERILRSGSHLLHLIDDVLEMSKIEAGRITLEPTPMDLITLVRDLEAMFAGRAQSKRLHLEAFIGTQVPSFVLGDPRKIRQILINLISNAIKFTDQGSVILRVSVVHEGTIQFEVEDTGEGVSPADQEIVFLPFEQSLNTRHRGGTGLGLAISHRFAELMKGSLKLTSSLGAGSLFTLTVPLPACSEPEGLLPPRTKQLSFEGEGPLALVVDDETDNLLVLANLLTGAGFVVQTAQSGLDALKQFEKHSPAVVLLDLRMPDMDGVEVCRRIRSLPQGQTTPILIVSASVMPESRTTALQAGANRFLRKPILRPELLQNLSQLLGIELEEVDPLTDPGQKINLSQADLISIPAIQRQALLQATLLGDIAKIELIINQVPVDEPIRIALQELADDFKYDELQKLLAPSTPEQAEPPRV